MPRFCEHRFRVVPLYSIDKWNRYMSVGVGRRRRGRCIAIDASLIYLPVSSFQLYITNLASAFIKPGIHSFVFTLWSTSLHPIHSDLIH